MNQFVMRGLVSTETDTGLPWIYSVAQAVSY